jgi:tetratricopeptide (TPR) repeat protein
MTADSHLQNAQFLYERAVFGGEPGALDVAGAGLDEVEADLCLARGRLVHAHFLASREKGEPAPEEAELKLFERAADLYGRLDDERGEGEALFWVGVYHQVVRDDMRTSLPPFHRALELATRSDDLLTVSYVLRHLGFAEHAAGQPAAARARLEESTRLRRRLGFRPGIAANLIVLAQFAAEDGRREEAVSLLDEAAELARATGSEGVAAWVRAAVRELNAH